VEDLMFVVAFPCHTGRIVADLIPQDWAIIAIDRPGHLRLSSSSDVPVFDRILLPMKTLELIARLDSNPGDYHGL
jgi:hypothetical protein